MDKLFKQINYEIKNKALLEQAFTHKSYQKGVDLDYERLEFLGDSVLHLVIAHQLFEKYPEYDEGALSKIKGELTSGKTLAELAIELNLDQYLKVQKPEDKKNPKILAGVFEAFLAVLYLDTNYLKTKEITEMIFLDRIKNFLSTNYKSDLQEWCQKKYKSVPKYKLRKQEGPEHKKVFYIDVFINNELIASGSDHQKKEAEKKAAEQALLNLDIDEDKK